MKTSWIKQLTKDKVELHALLFEPEAKSEKIIIHFHGKEGNFINNRFLYTMKDYFPSKGISFMTVNQRGHDYMSEALVQTPSGFEYKKFGFAYDVFEDCTKDIESFINFAIDNGYRKIFLEGHSLPHKCIYYLTKTNDKRVSGIISICNSDLLFEFTAYVENYEENLKLAEALVKSGQGDRMMPVLMWAGAYASAKTFFSYGNPKGNAQIFSFSDPTFKFETLGKITVPIVYIEPETDFSMGIDPKESLEICKKYTKNSQAQTIYISKTSHSFINAEDKLCKEIVEWIKSLK